ncbi:MAG: DNA cytosine methyltransferase [Lewinella sp.]|nr:DNA cytosine methyltransferase [Lewinella sp.]
MREGKEGGGKGPLVSEDRSLTLATANDQVLAYRDTADTLTAAYGTNWNGNASADNGSLFAQHGMQVRRLTPVECLRLQSFPDDYLSQVTWRKKTPPPDSVMYKAMGNSWTVNVVRYLGEQIERLRHGQPGE